MEIDVIVTTWGHPSWLGKAQRTAVPSAFEQASTHLIYLEDAASAGDARNRAVETVDPQEWICFLDADDQLEPGYIDAMRAAGLWRTHLGAPALRLPGKEPETYPDRDIVTGLNPYPIGTLIHRTMFEQAGQFWGESAWEDWSLFRRAVLHGAAIRFVPDAVYNATASTRSGRNSTVRNPKKLRREIIEAHNLWMNL